jgi:hypothetical protein
MNAQEITNTIMSLALENSALKAQVAIQKDQIAFLEKLLMREGSVAAPRYGTQPRVCAKCGFDISVTGVLIFGDSNGPVCDRCFKLNSTVPHGTSLSPSVSSVPSVVKPQLPNNP